MGRTVPFADRFLPPDLRVRVLVPEVTIVTPKAPRRRPTAVCPSCGAGADRRVPSSGFGPAHATCQACGYEYPAEE